VQRIPECHRTTVRIESVAENGVTLQAFLPCVVMRRTSESRRTFHCDEPAISA
jgi:hypothetical protein